MTECTLCGENLNEDMLNDEQVCTVCEREQRQDNLTRFEIKDLFTMRDACHALAKYSLEDKALLEMIEKDIQKKVEAQ